MARKRKPLPILENITITDVAAEGKALAKVDNLVVFVPYAVPGDVVDLQVRRKSIVTQRLKSFASTSTQKSVANLSVNTLVCAVVASGNVFLMRNSCAISKSKLLTI